MQTNRRIEEFYRERGFASQKNQEAPDTEELAEKVAQEKTVGFWVRAGSIRL